MRKILFRGIRKDTHEWVYGFYGEYFNSKKNIPCITIADAHAIAGSFCYEVIPETVGQFTGLTDKNGARVFEGDVMEFTAYGEHYKGVVYIYKGNFGIFCKPPSAHCEASPFLDNSIEEYNAVVIGNIYDNPELLEVTE